MTVWVDNFRAKAKVGRLDAVWCHMTADSTEELVVMSSAIGLKPSWIQHAGTWQEHFDVTEPKRRLAVAKGAVEVGALDGVRAMKARWEAKEKQHASEQNGVDNV